MCMVNFVKSNLQNTQNSKFYQHVAKATTIIRYCTNLLSLKIMHAINHTKHI